MKKSPPECERPQNKPASQLQMAPHPHGGGGILIGVTAPRETSWGPSPEKYAPSPLPAGTSLSSVGLQRECPKNKNINKKSGTLQKRFDIAGRIIYSSFFREVVGHRESVKLWPLFPRKAHRIHLHKMFRVLSTIPKNL